MTVRWRIRAALLGCVAWLVGCDHASKLAATAALRDRPSIPLIPGLLDLSYAENRDVAFNALSRVSVAAPVWVLTALTMATTLAVLVVWMRRRRLAWPAQAGFVFVLAGAIGNGADRLLRGHVVDFVHLHHWPVFNLADVLIVAGIPLLAYRPREVGQGH